MSGPSPTARLYARPTGFVDTLSDCDGQVARLAGGLQFFSAWEMIAAEGGKRAGQWLVPVSAAEHWCAALPIAQGDRLRDMMARAMTARAPLAMGDQILPMDQPQVMGILNVTPDSFSGGNAFLDNPGGSATLARQMLADGAAIIDLGGESTRPGADIIDAPDELARVLPVVKALAGSGAILSLDTRKAMVMKAGLEAGAHIINDVSALLYDDQALSLVCASDCPVVLMHFAGTPQDPHHQPGYADPLLDVYDWLEARIEAVVAAGLSRARIIADPGIGFGKRSVGDNLSIMNGLALFHGLGVPILLGASRKRIVAALSHDAPTDQRLGGSIALALKAIDQGAQIVRVHDVFETAQALSIWRGHRETALSLA